jgi:hypothetical protein
VYEQDLFVALVFAAANICDQRRHGFARVNRIEQDALKASAQRDSFKRSGIRLAIARQIVAVVDVNLVYQSGSILIYERRRLFGQISNDRPLIVSTSRDGHTLQLGRQPGMCEADQQASVGPG